MSRFTISRSSVDDDSVAIIDQLYQQEEDAHFAGDALAQPALPPAMASVNANLSHHMATMPNEALGLIPAVQTKTKKTAKRPKRGSPFKKYGSTNGNLPLYSLSLSPLPLASLLGAQAF